LPLFLKDRLLGPHAARTLQQLTRGLRWQTAVVIAGILLSLVAFVSGNSFALVVFVLVALMDLGMRAWFAVLLFEVRAAFTAAMAPRP
jgi:hypothetical protein